MTGSIGAAASAYRYQLSAAQRALIANRGKTRPERDETCHACHAHVRMCVGELASEDKIGMDARRVSALLVTVCVCGQRFSMFSEDDMLPCFSNFGCVNHLFWEHNASSLTLPVVWMPEEGRRQSSRDSRCGRLQCRTLCCPVLKYSPAKLVCRRVASRCLSKHDRTRKCIEQEVLQSLICQDDFAGTGARCSTRHVVQTGEAA